ncbi:T9SS type A sorting domain-containing protein [Hymenobacter aranciens]
MTVTNILTLQNGFFITGPNTIFLTNTATQPIVGTSSTAYVQGRLAISFPNTASMGREFPVGANSQYRPVTIRQEATGSNPVVLVEVIPVQPTGSIDPSLSNLSRARYYRVFLLAGTIGSPTVQLSFNTEGLLDEFVNVPGNLRIARSTAATGPWTNEGGSGVYSPAFPRGYAVSGATSITNNSLFTLASTNSVDNPLPVELTRFTATAQASSVATAWSTASEKNSAYFEVERSADGRTFTPIGRVEAAGFSSTPRSYSLRDAQPLPGLSYYRLRLVDADATFSYSPVVAVRFTGKADAPTVVAYPNPSQGSGFRLAATNLPAGRATVLLTDAFGRRVGQQVVDFTAADVAVPLAQPLPAGLYVLTVQTSAGSFVQKLVVE